MSLAAVGEAAALAGLPAEPAAYGLPAAASRRRPGGRDVFRTSDRQTGDRKPSQARPAAPKPDNRHEPDHDDQSPPTVWSTP